MFYECSYIFFVCGWRPEEMHLWQLGIAKLINKLMCWLQFWALFETAAINEIYLLKVPEGIAEDMFSDLDASKLIKKYFLGFVLNGLCWGSSIDFLWLSVWEINCRFSYWFLINITIIINQLFQKPTVLHFTASKKGMNGLWVGNRQENIEKSVFVELIPAA